MRNENQLNFFFFSSNLIEFFSDPLPVQLRKQMVLLLLVIRILLANVTASAARAASRKLKLAFPPSKSMLANR